MQNKTANGEFYYYDVVNNKTLDEWVQEIHKHMSTVSGWEYRPLKQHSYGYENILMSLVYASNYMNSTKSRDVNEIANEIHLGWCANYKYWRDNEPAKDGIHIKPFTPLGDERRNMCANTHFNNLPDDEKHKDIMIAEYILQYF